MDDLKSTRERLSQLEVDRFQKLDPSQKPGLLEVVNGRYEAGKVWRDACTLHHFYDKGADGKLKRIMAKIGQTELPPYNRKKWDREYLRDAAQGSPEWEEYIQQWNEAYDLMLDAINEKTAWENALEALRTESVNERELRKNG